MISKQKSGNHLKLLWRNDFTVQYRVYSPYNSCDILLCGIASGNIIYVLLKLRALVLASSSHIEHQNIFISSSRCQRTGILNIDNGTGFFNKCMDPLCVSTDSNLNVVADLGELSFRAISPASSNHRGSQCSQVTNSISSQLNPPHPSFSISPFLLSFWRIRSVFPSQDQEDRAEVDICPEQQHQQNDRKFIRKEKARLARLAATQVNMSEVSSSL